MVDIDGNSTQPKQDSNRSNSPKNENEIEGDVVENNDEAKYEEDLTKLYDTVDCKNDSTETSQQQQENEEITTEQKYDNNSEERKAGGSPSPTGSTHSQPSEDEPAEIPSLTGPFPEKKLLIFPPQKMYLCVKCKEILREPVQIKACGHRLCYQCHEEIRSASSRRCPEDYMELEDKTPVIDKAFRDEIEKLEVECQNSEHGCEWKETVQNYPDHVEICEFIDIRCEYDCGTRIIKSVYQKHLDKDCPKYCIKCPYCRDIIIREDKKSHFKECEKLPIPCPNKCDKQTVPRDKFDKHLETKCPRSKIVCGFEDVGCSHKTSREMMSRHVTREIADHVQLLHGVDVKHKGLLNEVTKRVQDNEFAVGEKDTSRIFELEKLSLTQFIWRIDDYTDKMHQAKAGNCETLFHPPFTTSKHGYRLCASVCLNGDGKSKGTHMSVFISVLKGPFDSLLKWPLECRISFTLLDQNPVPSQRKHIKFSIKPNPCQENEPFLGRPKMEKNASFGCTKFAEHEEIESRNYTDDNAIFLKIAIDWDCDGVSQP